jgi:hypothetical protein
MINPSGTFVKRMLASRSPPYLTTVSRPVPVKPGTDSL